MESTASDIVYANLFTGVHDSYLRKSIESTDLDPNALPESDPGKMNFGSGGGVKAEAWKDIRGAGQGIGVVERVIPTTELVRRFTEEFEVAHRHLNSIEAPRTVADSRATA